MDCNFHNEVEILLTWPHKFEPTVSSFINKSLGLIRELKKDGAFRGVMKRSLVENLAKK